MSVIALIIWTHCRWSQHTHGGLTPTVVSTYARFVHNRPRSLSSSSILSWLYARRSIFRPPPPSPKIFPVSADRSAFMILVSRTL